MKTEPPWFFTVSPLSARGRDKDRILCSLSILLMAASMAGERKPPRAERSKKMNDNKDTDVKRIIIEVTGKRCRLVDVDDLQYSEFINILLNVIISCIRTATGINDFSARLMLSEIAMKSVIKAKEEMDQNRTHKFH